MPSSSFPLNSSTASNFFPATPEIKTDAKAFATIQYSWPTLHFTYSKSGWTIMPRLNAIVHGVVVHIMKNSSFLPFTSIFTKIDLSFTSLYSSSCLASAVWFFQSQAMLLSPSYSLFASCAFFTSHHSPSMYSFVTDWYAFSKSIHTPNRIKSWFITLRFLMLSSLQAFVNLSTPNLTMSSLVFSFSSFSAAFSVGRPCMSYPALSITLKPCILL